MYTGDPGRPEADTPIHVFPSPAWCVEADSQLSTTSDGFKAHGGSYSSKEYKAMLNILKNIYNDESGQDLIEYALMAGFVAVAAGAIMPGVSTSVSEIFSKVGSVMTSANTSGS